MRIKSYKPNEINDCREASQISATILDELVSYISEGITTGEIDNYCLERIKKILQKSKIGTYRCKKKNGLYAGRF